MNKITCLILFAICFLSWPTKATSCSANALATGCPVYCFVSIVGGVVACSENHCWVSCKSWDLDGNPIENNYYACDNCNENGGGGTGGTGGGGGNCDYTQPFYWIYCDPWAM